MKTMLRFVVLALAIAAAQAAWGSPLDDAKAGLEAMKEGRKAAGWDLFTKALQPTDMSHSLGTWDRELALVKRAELSLGLGRKFAALNDAKSALATDPTDVEAMRVRDAAFASLEPLSNDLTGAEWTINFGSAAGRSAPISKKFRIVGWTGQTLSFESTDQRISFNGVVSGGYERHDVPMASVSIEPQETNWPNGDIIFELDCLQHAFCITLTPLPGDAASGPTAAQPRPPQMGFRSWIIVPRDKVDQIYATVGPAASGGLRGNYDAVASANEGLAALQSGNNTGAILKLRTAIGSGDLSAPDLELAYVTQARAWMGQEDPVAALLDLNQALRLNPRDREASELQRQILGPLGGLSKSEVLTRLRDKINENGEVQWGAGPVFSYTLRVVSLDVGACVMTLHQHRSKDAVTVVDGDFSIGIKDLSLVSIFKDGVSGRETVYFDNPGGTQVNIDTNQDNSAHAIGVALVRAVVLCGGRLRGAT